MPRNPYNIPKHDPIADENRGVTDPWNKFFSALSEDNAIASSSVANVDLETQAASISSTDVPIQTTYTSVYRVSWYARITRAATASSSLTVSIGWTESSMSLSAAGAAITGNTTTTVQLISVPVLIDGNSPLTYSTTYSSTGATAMQYRLRIVVERIG